MLKQCTSICNLPGSISESENRKNLPISIPCIFHLHRSESDRLRFLNCFCYYNLLVIILISTLPEATSLLKVCYCAVIGWINSLKCSFTNSTVSLSKEILSKQHYMNRQVIVSSTKIFFLKLLARQVWERILGINLRWHFVAMLFLNTFHSLVMTVFFKRKLGNMTGLSASY